MITNFTNKPKVLVDLGSTNKTLREALPMVDLSQKKIITSVRFVSQLLLFYEFQQVTISYLASVPSFVSKSLQSFTHNTLCVYYPHFRFPIGFLRHRMLFAEEDGFEPPLPFSKIVFKTTAINHSATPLKTLT
jgi:hypothetical protein